ncbi:MAG TPA: DUF2388 domain-containing protein [Thermomonas sp.]
MPQPRLTALILSLVLSSPTLAGSFGSSATSAGSATSASTSGDDKVILAAREDAASFVATGGQVRGARLEAALRLLRERRTDARAASDLQLAQAILAR